MTQGVFFGVIAAGSVGWGLLSESPAVESDEGSSYLTRSARYPFCGPHDTD